MVFLNIFRVLYYIQVTKFVKCTNFGMFEYFHVLFFFSSRRRHTRLSCEWSSDVCSSDLSAGGCSGARVLSLVPSTLNKPRPVARQDRKSGGEGKRVDLGGRRLIKKKKHTTPALLGIGGSPRSPRSHPHLRPQVG